jgi:integrase
MRFAVRNGWIADSPVGKLETDERPHPARRTQRVLGREEIARLLGACLPAYRVDRHGADNRDAPVGAARPDLGRHRLHRRLAASARAAVTRADRAPARRVAPKTPSAARDIPLAPQLAIVLREHRAASTHRDGGDGVFATRNGTPFSQRNVQRSAPTRAACLAGLYDDSRALGFHVLRHTFASHLIVDLHLDVVQVSRILGRASVSTTLDVYAHLFDEARHAADIRARMAGSALAGLLDPDDDGTVIVLPAAVDPGGEDLSARERAAIRWAT